MYDLDGNIVTGFQTACQLDLAVNPSTNLVDDLVLVYEFAASDEILFNLSFVGSNLHMSVSVMTLWLKNGGLGLSDSNEAISRPEYTGADHDRVDAGAARENKSWR